jgi:activator of 2-hydroxyglutaryl-CoA dehydratase
MAERGEKQMYSLGIDIGYSSIKLVIVDGDHMVKYHTYILHKGRIRETLKKSIEDLLLRYDSEKILFGSVTGSGGKFLTKNGKTGFSNEVAAIVEGGTKINKNIGSIIEIGGQSANRSLILVGG